MLVGLDSHHVKVLKTPFSANRAPGCCDRLASCDTCVSGRFEFKTVPNRERTPMVGKIIENPRGLPGRLAGLPPLSNLGSEVVENICDRAVHAYTPSLNKMSVLR